jgi:hypothetical protein
MNRASTAFWILAAALAGGGVAAADQTCPSPTPVPPLVNADGVVCHPSTCTPDFCARSDISPLPAPLQNRLTEIDCSPKSVSPLPIFAEADKRSLLFQYYLLDSTGFEPSVFTTLIPGVNDQAMLTVFGANCNLPTIGSVRLALEPKPGLPTEPDDPRAFIDIFTDIRGLFVINNESGWYEGWMIHDLRVAPIMPKGPGGHALFGAITPEDAKALQAMGGHNNTPGNFFTVDGQAPHLPSPTDHFPDKVTNVVPIQLSMGAYNALQQADAHNYWEFNYQTNWIHPLYELPFTGGFPDRCPTDPADAFQDGEIGRKQSIVPGTSAGLNLDRRRATALGDNPSLPRDPDRFDADDDSQREFRERFIPSGLAHEIFLDVYERPMSFRPELSVCGHLEQRLEAAYKAEIDCVDTNHDGVISAAEGDIDTKSCGFDDNSRLFLSPRTFNRFAVTREINDGLLAPRFAPSTRAWALAGMATAVSPAIEASQGRDGDDR